MLLLASYVLYILNLNCNDSYVDFVWTCMCLQQYFLLHSLCNDSIRYVADQDLRDVTVNSLCVMGLPRFHIESYVEGLERGSVNGVHLKFSWCCEESHGAVGLWERGA